MSKIRQQVDESVNATELSSSAEGDLTGYVIFTQLRSGGPYVYAGWLDAPDDEMALILAKEHYGRDQKCTAIWAAPRNFVGGLRENADAAREAAGEARQYQIFTQQNAGDQYISSIEVAATSATEAIARAGTMIESASSLHHLWAIPCERLLRTDDADVIWRTTDQSYRLARGYSKDVREKWRQFRGDEDVSEYEKDDLKESF